MASLFIGGTSSNAGKSWVTTAVCAWLRSQGVRVAPFKAQTMSNHSFPCIDGGEIGRAQVSQAEACGLEPESAMNPILLKPNTDGTSQVIVRGRVWKTLSAREYYDAIPELRREVLAAYDDLASRFDVVIAEGAGSVTEINLRRHDLVNLWLVLERAIPWILVADIERGGVFGAVAGTMALLQAPERDLFRGVLINKFRGDAALFDEGRALIETQCGAPCLGVWPFAPGVSLAAEDSLAVSTAPTAAAPPGASIGIVGLPTLSNGTDFSLLTWAEWISAPVDRVYDVVVLPGTKDTLGALRWLRERGLDTWVHWQYVQGARIIGVCGGYQILGEVIRDPGAHDGGGGEAPGLGLLPVETLIAAEKTTERRRATTPGGASFDAYEIHLGVTTHREPLDSFCQLEDGSPEGARLGRVSGTYLHGALEHAVVCEELFGVPVKPAPSRAHGHHALAEWLARDLGERAEWLTSLALRNA